MLCVVLLVLASASSHPAPGRILPGFSIARRADMEEAISPTTGAAMARLLSISVGRMSSWMNSAVGDHSGLFPWPSSQFSRAPMIMTTSAWASTKERAAAAD